MTYGDTSGWRSLFGPSRVAAILSLVVKAWGNVRRPTVEELEVPITIRLYSAMVKHPSRQEHPFLIQYEDNCVDLESEEVTGRKDIVIRASLELDVYFCIEAKRLNARVNGRSKALAAEYVKDGMQRFVDYHFSRIAEGAAMVGYVMDGDVVRALTNVAAAIETHRESLRLVSQVPLAPTEIDPTVTDVRETQHQRAPSEAPFSIYHVFLSCID